MSRLDRLREGLEAPLLVSSPINVRYLTGLASSNASLIVEPERVRLLTDFRYIERARTVDGVEAGAGRARRDRRPALAHRRAGSRSRPASSPTRPGSGCARRASSWSRRTAPSSGSASVKDETEIEAIRRACAVSDRAFEAMARERFTGRTERELAWRMEELLHEHGGHGTVVRHARRGRALRLEPALRAHATSRSRQGRW